MLTKYCKHSLSGLSCSTPRKLWHHYLLCYTFPQHKSLWRRVNGREDGELAWLGSVESSPAVSGTARGMWGGWCVTLPDLLEAACCTPCVSMRQEGWRSWFSPTVLVMPPEQKSWRLFTDTSQVNSLSCLPLLWNRLRNSRVKENQKQVFLIPWKSGR